MHTNALKWTTAIVAILTALGGIASAFYARPTREEVEKQLRERSAGIAARLEKLDDRLRAIEQRLARIEGALQHRGK